MYYSKQDYKLIKFERSKVKGKQYAAILENKQTKRQYKVNFGSMMENYQDKTGLNLYSQLIHGDKKRRANYKSRHSKDIKEGYYSPGYFALNFLW